MDILPDIKVSLIIPVYNVENYIEKCLSSVVNQTLQGIEIILVNDGSTDQSMDIVNIFENEHSNIRIINKENGGLSSARNSGLKIATGKYIAFLDSDDYIDETMLEKMYKRAVERDLDIVSCNLTKVDPDQEILGEEKNVLDYSHTYNKYDVISEYLLNNIPAYAWNKMYRKSLFDKYKITYPEGKLYEDIPTTFELLFRSNRIGFIDESLYLYVQRADAITKVPSFKAGRDIISTIDAIKSSLHLNELYYKYEEVFQNFSLRYLFLANVLFYKRYFLTKDEDELKSFKELASNRILSLNSKSILSSKYLGTIDKLKYILLKTGYIYLAVLIQGILLKAKNKLSMEG